MPSFKTTAIAAIALFVSTQAQSQYYIDPNSVPLSTRRKLYGPKSIWKGANIMEKNGVNKN